MLRRIGLNMFPQCFESVGVLGDVVAVVEPFFDDETHQAKRQALYRYRAELGMCQSAARAVRVR